MATSVHIPAPLLEAVDRRARALKITNAVSALMKGDSQVVARLERHDRTEIVIPGPVAAEIAHGIERLPRSKTPGLAVDDWSHRG